MRNDHGASGFAWGIWIGLAILMGLPAPWHAKAQEPSPHACPYQLAQMQEYADSLAREILTGKYAHAGWRVHLRQLCAMLTIDHGCSFPQVHAAIQAMQAAAAAIPGQKASDGAPGNTATTQQ